MKKRTFISKTTAVLLSLSVAAGNLALDPSTSLGAARHTKKYTFSTAEKVEKALTGEKSGAYVYYLNKSALMRVKGSKKPEKIATGVKQFNVQEKYIYVLKKKNNTLYRITIKNPAKQKKLISSCKELLGVSFSHITYRQKKGIYSTNLRGKKAKKLVSSSLLSNGYKYYKSSVFYVEKEKDSSGRITGVRIQNIDSYGDKDASNLKLTKNYNISFFMEGKNLLLSAAEPSAPSRPILYQYEDIEGCFNKYSAAEEHSYASRIGIDTAGIIPENKHGYHVLTDLSAGYRVKYIFSKKGIYLRSVKAPKGFSKAKTEIQLNIKDYSIYVKYQCGKKTAYKIYDIQSILLKKNSLLTTGGAIFYADEQCNIYYRLNGKEHVFISSQQMAQCTEDALGEGANCLVGELPVILKAWRKKNRIYFYCYVDVEENIIMRSYYIVSQKTNGKGFDYEYQKTDQVII